MRRGAGLLVVTLLLGSGCARNAERLMTEANGRFARGDYPGARTAYEQVLKIEPRSGDAYYRLALTEFRLGEEWNAQKNLQRALDLQPENRDAYTRLIDLYVGWHWQAFETKAPAAKQDYLRQELESFVQAGLRRDPNLFDALRARGYLALMREDGPGAVPSLLAAHRQRPGDQNVAAMLVQALTLTGQLGEAQTLAEQFLSRHPAASRMYGLLADLHKKRGDLVRAERLLASRVENNPADLPGHLQLIDFHRSAGQRDEARAAARRLLNSPALTAPGCEKLAGLLVWMEEFDVASEAYQTGEKRFPKEATVFRKGRADALVAQGKPDEARQLLEELRKTAPRDQGVLLRLGQMALRRGDHSGSLALLEEAAELTPEDPAVLFPLGEALSAAGRWRDAQTTFAKVLTLQPYNGLAMSHQARALASSGGDLDLALTLAQRASRTLPGDPVVIANLAYVHTSRGLYASAIPVYQKLVSEHPGEVTYRIQLADALQRSGDRQGALELLTAIPAGRGSERDRREREDLLRRLR